MLVRVRTFAVVLLLCFFLLPWRTAGAYSLLTHEQLIDLTWDSSIVPLLKSRYPELTPAQIEHARAYAYGGCVIQDIGYYPFGDKEFSNLTHYVRSGDFVVNLFRNAGNADELAFAVGALSHYIGDSIGHANATNLAVPVEFPKLQEKYGNNVSYAYGTHQHVRTEFGFDIDQIAHHRFAPVRYLRSVGLEVPEKQLELAYFQTYGLKISFSSTRHARHNVGTYRWAVRRFIPRIAYATTVVHRHHEVDDVASDPDVQRLERAVAEVERINDWEKFRKKPGPLTYTLAGLIRVLPHVGPLQFTAVKGPTGETEQKYVHSLVASTDALNHAVRRFTPPPATVATAAKAADADINSQPPPSAPLPAEPGAQQETPRDSTDPRHPLTNRDLDTGNPVKPAGYPLTDATYAYLLHRLTSTPTQPVPPGIKEDILAYYADDSLSFATRKAPDAWQQVEKDLQTLRSMPTSDELEPYQTYEVAGETAADATPAPGVKRADGVSGSAATP